MLGIKVVTVIDRSQRLNLVVGKRSHLFDCAGHNPGRALYRMFKRLFILTLDRCSKPVKKIRFSSDLGYCCGTDGNILLIHERVDKKDDSKDLLRWLYSL